MHEEELKIPSEHSLVQTNTEWKQKKGQDTDTYWYNEIDAQGNIIAKYVVKDSTSMYPPFGRNITFEKEVV